MNRLEKITSEVYYARTRIGTFSNNDVDFLIESAKLSPRNRCRICFHNDTSNELHEMLVAYLQRTYVRPNKHLRKSESLQIVKGAAEFVFFEDNGDLIEKVQLDADGKNGAVYLRVPPFVFHTIFITTPEIVIFEATPGPFDPTDTVYAEWSPEEDNNKAIQLFRDTFFHR